MNASYRFRVEGRLSNRWWGCFGARRIETESDGTTVLEMDDIDQAAFHGIVARFRDMGLPLVSIRRIEAATYPGTDTEEDR